MAVPNFAKNEQIFKSEKPKFKVIKPRIANFYSCGQCHLEFETPCPLNFDNFVPRLCSNKCKFGYLYAVLALYDDDYIRNMLKKQGILQNNPIFNRNLSLFELTKALINEDLSSINEVRDKGQLLRDKDRNVVVRDKGQPTTCLYNRHVVPNFVPNSKSAPKRSGKKVVQRTKKEDSISKWF